MEPVVALHPARARLLADALDGASHELSALARAVGQDLLADGEELRPAAHVQRAATVLGEEARRLAAVVARVEAWEAPTSGDPGAVRWSGPVTASHRQPHAAHREARRVAAAVRQGDAGALLAIDARWSADPVFAVVLLHAIGPGTLVGALDRAARTWGHPDDEPERRHAQATVAVLATLLATTARAGPPAFTVPELVAAADRHHVPPAALALLVPAALPPASHPVPAALPPASHPVPAALPPASNPAPAGPPGVWPAAFLQAMVAGVVAPLDRAIVAGRLPPSAAWLGAPGRAVDLRVLVLSAVATDRRAARWVASSAAVTHLVDGRAEHLDGGEAMARVLEAATTPRSTADIARLAPVMTATARAVAAADRLPPVLQERLGRLAAPWIGGFGGDDFGRRGTPHPLPALRRSDAIAFLEHAVARRSAAQDVRVAVDAWVRATLAAVPPDGPAAPSALRHVGAVLRAVHDAERAVEAAERAASDRRNERKGVLFDHAVDAVAVPPTLPAVPRVAAVVTAGAAAELLPLVLPATDAELAYLRTTPVRLAWEHERLQHRVVAAYWDRRATNGLFAPPGRGPAGDRARPVPAALVGAGGRLRPVEELTPSERALFQEWLYRQDGTRLAQLVNAASAEYGLSGGDRTAGG